jgi:hypothetical protein
MIPVDKQKSLKVSVENNLYKPKTGRTVTDLKMSTNPFESRNQLNPNRQLHVAATQNLPHMHVPAQQPNYNMAAMGHVPYPQSNPWYQIQVILLFI